MEWIDKGDCKRAGEEINKGIELNEPRAYFLADFLFDATGCVDQDLERAAQYYRRAAELGETEATNFLGLMYGLGRGVEQDYRAAYRWYVFLKRNDAEFKSADASRELAQGYAMTITQMARSRVRYPPFTADEGTVYATFDVATGQVTFEKPADAPEPQRKLRVSSRFAFAIENAYAAAVKEAPRPDELRAMNFQFQTPWKFERK